MRPHTILASLWHGLARQFHTRGASYLVDCSRSHGCPEVGSSTTSPNLKRVQPSKPHFTPLTKSGCDLAKWGSFMSLRRTSVRQRLSYAACGAKLSKTWQKTRFCQGFSYISFPPDVDCIFLFLYHTTKAVQESSHLQYSPMTKLSRAALPCAAVRPQRCHDVGGPTNANGSDLLRWAFSYAIVARWISVDMLSPNPVSVY